MSTDKYFRSETIIAALARRGKDGLHSLTAVSNNAGGGDGGGLAPLVNSGQIERLILSYLGANKTLERKYLTGEVAIELCPQGTIAERIRAGGAGIPAFYTPTGVSKYNLPHSRAFHWQKLLDTLLQSGDIPVRLGPKDKTTGKSTVLEAGKPRETKLFNGKLYNLEEAIKGDVAILRAWKVDTEGNCQFRWVRSFLNLVKISTNSKRYTTKAFGQVVAKAAKITIVEAENIVPVGEIHPDNVHVPGIYVDRIVPATVEKQIELVKLLPQQGDVASQKQKSEAQIRRERIAKRTAKELKHGYYVNLGVGMPTLAPSYLKPETKVWIQSENGILGMGPYPTEDQVDAYVFLILSVCKKKRI